MKVLIIHQHFKTPYSGGAIRSYYLARALADRGIQPVVITAHNKAGYEVMNIDGIEVHYLPVGYDNAFGFYKRSVSFIRFVWSSISLASKFDGLKLCYAISVPLTVGIVARYLKWKYGLPYIFEVGDLWPDAPVQMGVIRNPFVARQLYKLEKKIYQEAVSVVGLSTAIVQNILEKVPDKDVHLIPNMADTDFFKPEDKDATVETELNVIGKFVISYVGAIGMANGLENFVDVAHVAQQSSMPVHFVLCGDGAMLNDIRAKVDSLKLKNFTIVPFQNRGGVRKILNITDAIFISYKPVPVLETGSPNKYFDGLAAGKMVIVNFGGWIRDEVETCQCGIYIAVEQPNDFVAKIRPFVQDRSLLYRFQQNARKLAEEKYSRRILSKNFVKILENAATH